MQRFRKKKSCVLEIVQLFCLFTFTIRNDYRLGSQNRATNLCLNFLVFGTCGYFIIGSEA